ncbi:MAG: geranylgeranyl reductase family protein [Anaerolineales bacterium]
MPLNHVEQRDILIVGAGPAGSAMAYFLATQGLDVLLVDKTDFPRDKTCGDGVSPRAMRVLRDMGIEAQVLGAGYRVNRIAIFAPNGRSVVAPVPAFGQLPNYALVLPRYQLDDVIRARAVEAGAEFMPRTNATEVLQENGEVIGIRAHTANGPREFRARVTVFATGASTSVLERAGLLPQAPTYGRAARTYYENVQGLSDAVEFHFDSVPLPGYGWVFPTSPTTANVGAGYFVRAGRQPQRNTPRQAFDEFIANRYVAGMLAHARSSAPIKGYPLRFDFPTARAAYPGLLLIGEAAGLVNPLTGEGIDYALESAEVAAEELSHALRLGESAGLAARRHTQALHRQFLRMFVNIIRVRDTYFRPWVLNRFVAAAHKHAELSELILNTALGNIDPLRAISLKTLLHVAIG